MINIAKPIADSAAATVKTINVKIWPNKLFKPMEFITKNIETANSINSIDIIIIIMLFRLKVMPKIPNIKSIIAIVKHSKNIKLEKIRTLIF